MYVGFLYIRGGAEIIFIKQQCHLNMLSFLLAQRSNRLIARWWKLNNVFYRKCSGKRSNSTDIFQLGGSNNQLANRLYCFLSRPKKKPRSTLLHPRKINMVHLQITHLERKMIFQTSRELWSMLILPGRTLLSMGQFFWKSHHRRRFAAWDLWWKFWEAEEWRWWHFQFLFGMAVDHGNSTGGCP